MKVEIKYSKNNGELVLEPHFNELQGFDLHIEAAANIIQSNKELVAEPIENFAVLDGLIDHVERKIFNASYADEVTYGVQGSLENEEILNNAYCAWETALEEIFVDKIHSGQVKSFRDYPLNTRFQRLLQRETSMLKGEKISKALFIGSGPLPISAIWLHNYLGIDIDCIDVCEHAINCSKVLLDMFDLKYKINVIHQPNPQYDVSEYDVIIIALLAKPKDEILNNIFNTMSDACEVICRTSFGLRKVIYEPAVASKYMLDKFDIHDVKVADGNSDDTISSMLLKKTRTST
ncbi:nicotianamine synthase-like protein [Alteromonas sp. 76-1]|jgi:hypothetical protein|uniref:nicotianamine synthase family protein n=1 Tax=Alteromonas sp. 76-1 TaxID=2358187 RepID=UPI000FD184B0|nr:nicotianamine synthase family protein [Alteromonas sp. 76-1]VEL98337.1 nicotianamine synthase-like protein [Alteromonas sp. 76-1]